MNKSQVNGMMDQVVGSAKRKAGKLTGNTKLKVEGMAQQAKGKVENAWGKTKEVVGDAVRNVEGHLEARGKSGVNKPPADSKRDKSIRTRQV